ncbi:MAG: TRAP transporter substrate-binding protein DctP [Bryobacterales bacterium]|nr:TRAP transporter substrate-binding protein DctP [Bryobacterales bacterium]
MRRLHLAACAALAAMVAVAALVEPAPAQRRRVNKIKLGTIAPKNSVYHEVLLRMRQTWREISAGAVDLTIYPGGVAGDEVTMLRKMRAGQMQGALISGSGMSFLDEGISALQVPLMFDSLEEFDFVRSKLAPTLEDRLHAKGFTVLGWGDAGWAYFFAVREFRTPSELRDMKLYTSKGDDEMLRLYSEFGLNAVPLDLTELQANLETGLVEVFAVPPLVAAGYQWFASAPHMLNMRFLPIVGAVLIANETWEAIPEEQRLLMEEAAEAAAREVQEAVRDQEAAAIEEMAKYGLNVVEADADAIAEWKREVDQAYPGLRDRYAPGELMDAAVRWRDEHRAR